MQAVIQLRGEVNMRDSVRDTLGMLNLSRVNHCTLVPETDSYQGMINKVNDYVAYGEPSVTTLASILHRRGEPAEGEGNITNDWVAEHTAYDDIDALATALLNEETTLREEGIAPVLRLHPPRGGHSGIKQPVDGGGELGHHSTTDIDQLLEAMH